MYAHNENGSSNLVFWDFGSFINQKHPKLDQEIDVGINEYKRLYSNMHIIFIGVNLGPHFLKI
jgi:hypothetical protein